MEQQMRRHHRHDSWTTRLGTRGERFNLPYEVETRGGYPPRNAIREQRQKRVVPSFICGGRKGHHCVYGLNRARLSMKLAAQLSCLFPSWILTWQSLVLGLLRNKSSILIIRSPMLAVVLEHNRSRALVVGCGRYCDLDLLFQNL